MLVFMLNSFCNTKNICLHHVTLLGQNGGNFEKNSDTVHRCNLPCGKDWGRSWETSNA